jgi:GMP synthase (glutamine-hydrolysing)
MPRKVLLIVHQNTSDPGRVGSILQELGFELDMRCPNIGELLPSGLTEHDGVVIFGGPMSANDGHDMPGIGAELEFISRVMDAGKPVLGICLGAQLIAKVLGAGVTKHPEGLAEIGYTRVSPTPEGRSFLGKSMMVYQWHREGFELPAGVTLLAEGETFRNQAFRYGDTVFALQFHPEVTLETIKRWTAKSAERLTLPGAQPRDAHLKGFELYDATVDRWIRNFLDHIFDLPRQHRQTINAIRPSSVGTV